MFYVYGLVDSSTDVCFYVGKGCKNRMYQHVNKVKRGASTNNPHLDHKIAKLLRDNISIEYIKFADNILDEDIAYLLEAEKINELGIDNLCNAWLGGKGGRIPSDETRRKISENRKGIIVSDATREKQRLAKLGTHQSDETKRKKSEALRGRPQTAAQRAANEKRRQALVGKPKTEEHKEKLRQAKQDNPVRYWQGKTLTDEHREKIRQSVLKAQENTNDKSDG